MLSRDPRTRAQEYKPVLQTVVTHTTRLYHVRYRAREHASRGEGSGASSGSNSSDADGEGEPGELVATGEHPFFVLGAESFIPAERLKAGDLLALAGGGLAEVLGLDTEEAPARSTAVTTFNFEVEGFNTYFVGREGVWVHNAGRAGVRANPLHLLAPEEPRKDTQRDLSYP